MCKIKNLYHLLVAVGAAVYYKFPGKKLVVIGVTGTDGKTTTVNLIHHILTEAGYKAAVISTLSGIHTTTPDTWKLQKFLAQSVKNGCTHAVLEVSSHAIDQHRIWGIDFAVGVLTNIAPNEHLDYHQTFENYKNTKLRFLKSCHISITPLNWPKNFPFETSLLGEFNRQNILFAAAAALVLKIPKETVKKAIKSFSAPSGRLEIVVKKPFTVIVDFAHTPQAFEAVLPVVKKLGKRLIHVFGATGDRDKSKRPLMGSISDRLADEIILTSEDTYSEKLEKILDNIQKGISRHSGLSRIVNRREAIKYALQLARPGDVVLLTGVGHQKSLNIAGREIPWSDQKVVLEILQNAHKK